jgi:hypothetical protein
MFTCVHCGEKHADEAKFCPATGKPIEAPAATERVRPLDESRASASASAAAAPSLSGFSSEDKGVFDLLKQAMELYRAHAKVFLITAAILFVPGSFVSSCALSLVLAPVMASAPATEQAAQRLARDSEEFARRAQEAAARGQADQRAVDQSAQKLGRDATDLASTAVGGFVIILLGLLGWAVTALVLYAVVLPLTQGALTIAVADRILGGSADWRQHWSLLFRRLGLVIPTLILMIVILVPAYFFFMVPGLVLSFLFTFTMPVVLIEGVGGMEALKRSYTLVRSDWLRTAIMLVVFGILQAISHHVASLFVPHGALFFGNFLGDILWLLLLPIPIIGTVLLYFDLRRKVEGLTEDNLRAELETLRPAE